MNDVHYSSASNSWETPDWLYAQLHREFAFDLDAAATAENAKCPRFYTDQDDALTKDWGKDATTVWLNPPYGRLIGPFVRKTYAATLAAPHLTVCMLIPSRTDTSWWHECCAHGEIRLIAGRLKFVNRTLPSYREDGAFKLSPAPFPSAIVIFGKRARVGQVFHVDYSPDHARQPETATIPVVPPDGLLESMATRLDHAFGMSAGLTDEQIEQARNGTDALQAAIARTQWRTTSEREALLGQMAQLHEEVVGKGFYRYESSRQDSGADARSAA